MTRRVPTHLIPLLTSLFLISGCAARHDNGAIVAAGHVEATEVRLAAKVGGRLARFDPREGDRLEVGQVVACIDTVDLALASRQAAADEERARAELRLLEAGSRSEDVAAAAAEVERTSADLESAERDLVRAETLLKAGTAAAQWRDDALTRRDMARARQTYAREQLRRLRAGARPEELAAARARLETARAALARVTQQVADATVTAPRHGIMTEKLAEPGEVVAAGAPLAEMVDLQDAWLNIYIPEPDLGRVRIGQPAVVTTDDGQSRTGHISFIASQAEFTPKNVQTRDERVKLVYRLKVTLDNADGLFKPGMPAEARLEPATAARAGS